MKIIKTVFLSLLCFALIFNTSGKADSNVDVIGNTSKPTLNCSSCKTTVEEFETLATQKSSVAVIESYLDSEICQDLPDILQSECKAIVKAHTASVLQDVITELAPPILCKELKLCNGTSKFPVIISVNQQPLKANSTLCNVCQYIVSTLAGMMGDPEDRNDLIKTVAEACSALPTKDQPNCYALINEYGEQIINIILNKETPDLVCISIDLCAKSLFSNPSTNKDG